MTQATAVDISNTEKWQNLDGAHHMHPFTNPHDLLEKPARIIESAGVDMDILHELEKGMVEDPERVANTCLIEVSPEGDFLTYGIDVSVLAMRDPHKAQGRAPVT